MTLIIPEKVIAEIRGIAVPKLANDQNTDDIMPARFLKEITFARMGEYVYADERKKDGQVVQQHPFNDAKYRGAKILLAGNNFGCGSSREHAPQGLYRWGIRAIVAEGFAEIFAGNCAAIGIVPVTARRQDIEMLAREVTFSEHLGVTLDLSKGEVEYLSMAAGVGYGPRKSAAPLSFQVAMPEGRRQAFLSGTWEAMAVLQANQAKAEQVRQRLPYLQ